MKTTLIAKKSIVGLAVTMLVGIASATVSNTSSAFTASGAGASAGSAGSTSSPTSSTPSAPMMTDSGQSSAGGVLKSTQDRVPVGNMPGVMLTGPGNSTGSAGSLDASGDNISLGSGTKLILSVAPASAPVGQ